MIWLLNLILTLFVGAFFLKVIATVIPGIEIEDMAAALQAVILMAVVQNVLMFVSTSLVPGAVLNNGWFTPLYSCVTTVIALALAAMVVAGIRIEGPVGVVLAGVLLTALSIGLRYGLQSARASGLVDAMTRMAG